MKILSAGQIREIDAKTIQYEGISSLELMKRAAVAFYDWFIKISRQKHFHHHLVGSGQQRRRWVDGCTNAS